MRRGEEVADFLRRYGMYFGAIDLGSLVESISEDMCRGLRGERSTHVMIPTYTALSGKVPVGESVIAIDAGGTYFRAALVEFDASGSPRISGHVRRPMPGMNKEIGKREFFAAIASYLDGIIERSSRIGFCFSYAIEITPNRDGRLLRFSKEIRAREVEGTMIGEELLSALAERGYNHLSRIALLNDSTATLLAGATRSIGGVVYDSYIGYILGTGMNSCYLESDIPKIGLCPEDRRPQIVVLEAGDFESSVRGDLDLEFDAGTSDPGKYTYQKMFSGGYLGGVSLVVLKRAVRDGLFGPAASAAIEEMSSLETKDIGSFLRCPYDEINPVGKAVLAATEADREIVYRLLDAMVERAALLACATISATMLKSGGGSNPARPVCVVVEGTTFYELKGLKRKTERHLDEFLEIGRERFAELVHIDNATLIGTALAGLLW
ncbi:MAG: hexokinase [Rectinemataceae bacterium]|jgi:hexokinase